MLQRAHIRSKDILEFSQSLQGLRERVSEPLQGKLQGQSCCESQHSSSQQLFTSSTGVVRRSNLCNEGNCDSQEL